MKKQLVFEDVENKILGMLGVTTPAIYKEEEGEEPNEEPMGAAEEPGEQAENESPEEEDAEESGDVDIEGMSYEDKMSLVLEIIDSFEDNEEQTKFIEELKAELETTQEDDEDFA